MLKQFKDKVAFSGFTILIIGIALLIFTFASAYGFLTQSLSIIASGDLAGIFGEALAPLISAGIRALYMGIMVWIGSLLTIRGITVITHLPDTSKVAGPKVEGEEQMKPRRVEVEKSPKESDTLETEEPSKPEFIVIPPEETQQPASQPNQQPEKTESKSAS